MYLTEIASKSLEIILIVKYLKFIINIKKDYPSGTALMLGERNSNW